MIALPVCDGCTYYPGYFSTGEQQQLAAAMRAIIAEAPLFQPTMPRTDKPFSVRMSNCGPLGWVSDKAGYRYQPQHPITGKPWPPMPDMLLALWHQVAAGAKPPEACLINWYEADAKMGLHQDRDEASFDAPIVSVSLGDSALFRIGGDNRKDKTLSLKLHSGDVIVFGGKARLAFHGIDRIYSGTGTLFDKPGRLNLTLRRVNP